MFRPRTAGCPGLRPTGKGHTPRCERGRCRKCWATCGNPLPDGRRRCDDCYRMLIVDPEVKIRFLLVQELDAPLWVLEALVDDPDLAVSQMATRRVDARQPLRPVG